MTKRALYIYSLVHGLLIGFLSAKMPVCIHKSELQLKAFIDSLLIQFDFHAMLIGCSKIS